MDKSKVPRFYGPRLTCYGSTLSVLFCAVFVNNNGVSSAKFSIKLVRNWNVCHRPAEQTVLETKAVGSLKVKTHANKMAGWLRN